MGSGMVWALALVVRLGFPGSSVSVVVVLSSIEDNRLFLALCFAGVGPGMVEALPLVVRLGFPGIFVKVVFRLSSIEDKRSFLAMGFGRCMDDAIWVCRVRPVWAGRTRDMECALMF